MARQAALIGAVTVIGLVLLSPRARDGLFVGDPAEVVGVFLGLAVIGAVPALILYNIAIGLRALTRRKPTA